MSIDQYLNRYAEPELRDTRKLNIQDFFENVLVIPACSESYNFVRNNIKNSSNLLLIVVINQPDSSSPEIKETNKKLIQRIASEYPDKKSSGSAIYHKHKNSGIFVINRCDHPIPEKKGVGMARKIGCDIALDLIHRGIIKSRWICNTDADATLPDLYFEKINKAPKTNDVAAIVFNFKHLCDDSPLGMATELYEQHLHYYRKSLAYAGSPYAFYALGSTIAVEACHYAQVRGFPKRNGGEDFYLLNKLAKTGRILFIENSVIEIAARVSTRVPFGTGPAVAEIMSMDKPELEYKSYNPGTFEELKALLAALPDMFVTRSNSTKEEALHCLSLPLQRALKDIDFIEGLEHCRKQSVSREQFLKHMHQWLDGFRTLKLIHALRKDCYPDMPLTAIKTTYFQGPNRLS